VAISVGTVPFSQSTKGETPKKKTIALLNNSLHLLKDDKHFTKHGVPSNHWIAHGSSNLAVVLHKRPKEANASCVVPNSYDCFDALHERQSKK
jgi:hypothetical protein